MSEPEIAIAFTADPWVEVLHRHLTDHGGARVRSLVVEPQGALDESYDVLVAGHRWSALTRALVQSGVGLEFMDIRAACRTYNILVSEERKVAAALLFD